MEILPNIFCFRVLNVGTELFPETAMTWTSMSQCYRDIDAAEHEEKHRRYEALYARRLRAKYFSKKAVDGGI